jgi:glyoxylase-like metal-dependent hydrolase (beta-lactamase superfamily II)/rhodanese-related sulfurtransferase
MVQDSSAGDSAPDSPYSFKSVERSDIDPRLPFGDSPESSILTGIENGAVKPRMIFRQLFDSETWTYTYLLADRSTGEALLIDTVFEKHLRDLALLRELGLELRYTIDTHVHADHVTGAWLMRQATGCRIAVARASNADGADLYLEDGDVLAAGSVKLVARATPGHTDGCMTYVLDDLSMAFTGDALLIRGAGRTDFQMGDARQLFKSVREQILSLPGECMLYPGHDYNGRTSTTVEEERAHNPRLGDGKREADFIGYMENLGLPHPKKMEDAVPANLKCGQPGDGASTPTVPDWGPVIRTFAGVLEIDPDWVHNHREELALIDVREPEELTASPLGHIDGSIMIPLSVLRDRLADVPKTRPVITVCPAGARSAQAALILETAGFTQVANLSGGLFRWLGLGYPIHTG